MEIDFKTKPTLIGNKVILRPFIVEDTEKMIEFILEPELRKLTGSVINDEEANKPFTNEDIERITNWYHTRNEQTDRLDLAIVDKATNDVVGEVVFNEYNPTTNNVNFRILIGAKGCNKGIGTEAISLFIKYGFEVLNLHKIELGVYSFNPRAEKVYRKNGFILEGIKREDMIYNGVYYDTKYFGMLKEDYIKFRDTSK